MVVRILTGDVRERLAELPDESVHCVVTSPPYFGLRDYGTAQWDGGDPDCDHKAPPRHVKTATSTLGKIPGYRDNLPEDNAAYIASHAQFKHTCGKCGATRIDNQIGLEPTLAEYIDTMTAVFRDVRRVLRSDGVCWLNIGDSYAGGAGGRGDAGRQFHTNGDGGPASYKHDGIRIKKSIPVDLKPKDLMMVPARLALALQADGWWLRSDIIWHKPNPMPESVLDRPTNAHEHIFLLTKSARYWYDADAVREDWTEASKANHGTITRGSVPSARASLGGDQKIGVVSVGDPMRGANLRNVWAISTVGFPGAHFATFPPEIPRRCIKAGTSEHGCCSACGAPWSRVVERSGYDGAGRASADVYTGQAYGNPQSAPRGPKRNFGEPTSQTLGWQPGCTCDADVIPCTVMDPFFGSGTTGLVADQIGRDCIGIELNAEYAAMAEKRIRDASPMFAQVTA